jgi:flagellar biosynthesis GTPase FlhF
MPKRDDPIDALFRLPLTEFIGARKELAARLKKNGYTDEAQYVKALAKPPISAWTVNQLFWNHRDEFDELISTGQRFRKAQASGKMVNMREALDARRDVLSQLSDFATEILTAAGHNPSLDVLRRITTTLEALSSLTSFSGETTPGRLTRDIDPPGFDSFGAFTPSAVTIKPVPKGGGSSPTVREGARAISSKRSAPVTKDKASPETKRDPETRQAKINSAKASLQNAKKDLAAAQAQKKSLEAAQKRADAAAREAEKQKFHAEERFKKAMAAVTEAAERADSITSELKEATKALEGAKRAVDTATSDLERSFQESQ